MRKQISDHRSHDLHGILCRVLNVGAKYLDFVHEVLHVIRP